MYVLNIHLFLCSLQSPKVHGYPDMETVPLLLSKVKAEPPEDLLSSEQFQTQTEPVDLSINKTRTSSPSSNTSPVTSAFSPSSSSSSSPSVITSVSSGMPSVLTPGPLMGSSHGVRGQQFLHIIHPVPPSSPSKLPSQVHRIPVVVQSLPLMYTTAIRSASTLNSTIMLPLLDEAKFQGKGEDLFLDCLIIVTDSFLILLELQWVDSLIHCIFVLTQYFCLVFQYKCLKIYSRSKMHCQRSTLTLSKK